MKPGQIIISMCSILKRGTQLHDCGPLDLLLFYKIKHQHKLLCVCDRLQICFPVGPFVCSCTLPEIIISSLLLSMCNALRRGYSNAAVLLSVCLCVWCFYHLNMIETKSFVLLFQTKCKKYDKRMNPFDFGGKRSKVNVTMDIYGIKLVNAIETEPLSACLSNLANMFSMIRDGLTLLILEVKHQGYYGHHWQMWDARRCYTLRCLA